MTMVKPSFCGMSWYSCVSDPQTWGRVHDRTCLQRLLIRRVRPLNASGLRLLDCQPRKIVQRYQQQGFGLVNISQNKDISHRGQVLATRHKAEYRKNWHDIKHSAHSTVHSSARGLGQGDRKHWGFKPLPSGH